MLVKPIRCLQDRRVRRWTIGAALFAAVVAASAAPADAGRPPPPPPIEKTFFGLHIFLPRQIKEWPDVGFGTWRLWDTAGTTWTAINPQRDRWDFDALDDAVARAQRGGVDVLLTLGQTPRWASSDPERAGPHGAGSSAPPRDIADWVRYVEVVTRRYKGRIRAYEVWNEPRIAGVDRRNDSQFFYGSAADLVTLTKTAHEVIKRVDPQALLVSPAFDGEGIGERRVAAFLEAGGACCFDVMSMHLYPHSGDIAPETMPPRVARLRALMARHGVNRPIWNTEFGYLHAQAGADVHPLQPSGFLSVVLPPDLARAYLLRSFILGAGAGIERFYWFAWDAHSAGLISARPNRRPTSAAAGYRSLVDWLVGGRVSECSNAGPRWECRYQGPLTCDGRFLWTTEDAWVATIPAPYTRLRHVGDTADTEIRGGVLRIGREPVLVHAGAPGSSECQRPDPAGSSARLIRD
jgi:hypothetical protein